MTANLNVDMIIDTQQLIMKLRHPEYIMVVGCYSKRYLQRRHSEKETHFGDQSHIRLLSIPAYTSNVTQLTQVREGTARYLKLDVLVCRLGMSDSYHFAVLNRDSKLRQRSW